MGTRKRVEEVYIRGRWVQRSIEPREDSLPLTYKRCTNCGRVKNVKDLHTLTRGCGLAEEVIKRDICFYCKEKILRENK